MTDEKISKKALKFIQFPKTIIQQSISNIVWEDGVLTWEDEPIEVELLIRKI